MIDLVRTVLVLTLLVGSTEALAQGEPAGPAEAVVGGDEGSGPRDGRASIPVLPAIQRPSVVILLGDDFNWVDLRSVATPNIDALAARGMTFTNNYVFPQCSTTRYSLVFGRYPRRDGIGELVNLAPPSPSNPKPPP